MTYNQPTSAPTTKVAAVGVAGIAAVLVPLLVTVLASFGVIVPDATANQVIQLISAIVTVYSLAQGVAQFAAGYFKKSKK